MVVFLVEVIDPYKKFIFRSYSVVGIGKPVFNVRARKTGLQSQKTECNFIQRKEHNGKES